MQPGRNSNPIEDNNANTTYQNDEGLYDFPPNEDDDAYAYAEITQNPDRQEEFSARSNEYDVAFSESGTAAKAAVIDYQPQNAEYSHLVHFGKKEVLIENYQTLSLNPEATFLSNKSEKKYSEVQRASPINSLQKDRSSDLAVYSEVNR